MDVRFSSPYTCNSRLDLWQQPKHTATTYSIIAHTCRFLTSLQAASFLQNVSKKSLCSICRGPTHNVSISAPTKQVTGSTYNKKLSEAANDTVSCKCTKFFTDSKKTSSFFSGPSIQHHANCTVLLKPYTTNQQCKTSSSSNLAAV